MLPKKSKDFVKPTAEELQVEEALVQNLTDFYWKNVRKALSDLKAPRIMIANFGSFNIKHWMLDKEKENYQKHLDRITSVEMTFQRHRMKVDVEERLKTIDRILDMVQKDKERKNQVKKKRNENISEADLGSEDENP